MWHSLTHLYSPTFPQTPEPITFFLVSLDDSWGARAGSDGGKTTGANNANDISVVEVIKAAEETGRKKRTVVMVAVAPVQQQGAATSTLAHNRWQEVELRR